MQNRDEYIPCEHSFMLHDVEKIEAGDWVLNSSEQYRAKNIDIFLGSGDVIRIVCFQR